MLHKKFSIASTRIKTVAFHPHLPIVIGGHHCGALTATDVEYGTQTPINNLSAGSIRTLKFHPSGKFFAAAGDDKVIRIYAYSGFTLLNTLVGHSDYIRSLDFHPTHPFMVSTSDDCTIKVWNYNSGELLSSSVGHHHYVMSVLFVDSTHIVSGSLDHTLVLWNCEKLLEISKASPVISMTPKLISLQVIDGHDRGVNTLFFSKNKLYSGSDDREIRVYTYNNSMLEYDRSIHAHEGNVTGIAVKEMIYGVGEDSLLSITTLKGRNESRIQLGTRGWSIDIHDGLLAIGTDDGLVLYKRSENICTTKSFYSKGKNIFYKGQPFISLKSNILSLQESEEKLVVNILGEGYNVYSTKTKSIIDSGKGTATYFEGEKYEFNVKLTINSKISSSFEDYIKNNTVLAVESTNEIVFLRSSKSIMILNLNILINSLVEIENVISQKIEDKIVVCLKGHNRLSICTILNNDHVLNDHTNNIIELVNITSTYFYNEILFYSTEKQLKYFINNITGVICSLENCNKIFKIKNLEKNENLIDKNLEKNENLTDKNSTEDIYADKNSTENISAEKNTNLNSNTNLSNNNTTLSNSNITLEYISQDFSKTSINLGEIEFKQTVLKEDNKKILNCIKKLQLPGLSPIEHLIKSNKGAVALPFIKDVSKRIRLLVSEDKFKEAYKEAKLNNNFSFNSFMMIYIADSIVERGFENEELLDISEEIYKKSNENSKLLFLQFLRKKENIESDSILIKIIKEDKKIFKEMINLTDKNLFEEKKENDESDKKEYLKVNDKKEDLKVNDEIDKNEFLKENDESNKNEFLKVNDESDKKVDNKKVDNKNEYNKKVDNKKVDNKNDVNNKNEDEKILTEQISKINISKNYSYDDSKESNSSLIVHDSLEQSTNDSNSTSDSLADINSDDDNSNNESISEIKSYDDSITDTNNAINDTVNNSINNDIVNNTSKNLELYYEALNYTTLGKFNKAVEIFREAIKNQKKSLRKRIGNYLIGLHCEKKRKELPPDSISNILEMSMFFYSLELESEHNLLTRKLAMNVNYKYKNYKTAKKIAEEIILYNNDINNNIKDSKDSNSKDSKDINNNVKDKKRNEVLESAKNMIKKIDVEKDSYSVEIKDLCYDTLKEEEFYDECEVCFVKSKKIDQVCPACYSLIKEL